MLVRLRGPEHNLDGFGAVLRLQYGERWGPAREVHGGGGYLSQDSPVQALSAAANPTGIQARWPGGKVMSYALPAQAREVELRFDGSLGVRR